MQRFLILFIVAGAIATGTGCKADNPSTAASQTDENPAPPQKRADAAESSPAPAPLPPAPSPAPPPAVPPVRDARPLVVCFGDSLTAGYGADEGQSYPDFLQKYLDTDGFHYRVVNEGISGNTTKDGVDRLSQVEQLKAAVVVLEFGGNDGLRGFKIETTRTNLGAMIAGLKRSGAKVVLAGMTLPPDYGPDYVTSFTASYPTLGKKFGVPVLPFLLKNVYGVPGLMQADNIHATNKGNAVVARNILPLVEPLLKK
jgi:acyl-CoA thioesterase-1